MPTKTKKKYSTKTPTTHIVAKSSLQTVPAASTQPVGLSSRTPVYVLTIFLGAFLLFQVQLILGKFVLPRFGGGPSVWSTSLLTFQILLLVGYGYAAVLTQHFTRRTQSRIHLGLLSASALAIAVTALKWHSPILPQSTASPSAGSSPVIQIVLLLVSAVGFPCLLLSASSPLLQAWFSNPNVGASPYRLYALSNLGSLLGLLSYPFVVERLLRLPVQAWLWTTIYLVFLATTAICALSRREHASPTSFAIPFPKSKTPAPRPKLLWLALSACGSMMLLATTNLICQDVAVIPLLWVVPLSLYLLSFIICFDHARWYRREIFQPLYLVLALLSMRTLLLSFVDLSTPWPLIIFCLTLLAVCMVCHGELARLKPEPQRLTGFYLMISGGGAIGSAFVVLVAPHLFNRFWEFQIALLGCGVLVEIVLARDPESWLHKLRLGRLAFAAATLVLVIGASYYTYTLRSREDRGHAVVWQARNFFGVKTVLRYEGGLILRHGRTVHGTQNTDPAVRDVPTAYYRPDSGIGLLLRYYPMRLLGPLRLGVIGMGAGTLAAYGHPGDVIRFYEIDPDVVRLSQGDSPIFTYVKDSRAHVEISTGDARIVLQQELARPSSQKIDILVIDAFSGDAIPVHLLTREAMAIYLQRLRGPWSVIAFHVSNRSIDLRPVVAALAREYHLASLEIVTASVSDWILVSGDPAVLGIPVLAANGHPIELTHPPVLWTDDYSNLYSLLTSW